MKNALKKIGKVLLVILIILAVFFFVVFIFHRVMLNKEKPLIAEPLGTMVEVDGGEMCVYTEGEGEHTIVFMSGYGTPSPILDFKPLYSRLSDDFRIVVVEKFGYGFSDETDMSRDIDTMLEQTRKAITGADIEGEFILCPHSASGIEAIYWAQKYPDEIEGIAFLDVAMPGYHEEAGYSIFLDELMQFIMNSGLGRLIPVEAQPYAYNTDDLTDEEKAQFKALLFARRGSETMIHEAEWCKENMETISDNAVPDVPMLFFTSKQMAAVMFPSDPEKYLTLAERYTGRAVENILLECGHCVHVEEPDFIAEKIRRFAENLDEEQ